MRNGMRRYRHVSEIACTTPDTRRAGYVPVEAVEVLEDEGDDNR